ncbi:hypothetical protein HMPREF3160_09290 [Arthrobacter sp. HMSC06H05]|nr:hypothetical protein HMPREF3160_09290 [Arthrobacter sp. HMSC06H05]
MTMLSTTAHLETEEAVNALVPQLVKDRVASRLAAKDSSLWGKKAALEAVHRLGWANPFPASGPLIDPIIELRDELKERGIKRIILAGTGGSTLASEVVSRAAGVELSVIDSTDPGMLAATLTHLDSTLMIVASKSGSTLEMDVAFRVFSEAVQRAGLRLTEHVLVITDPDSPLEQLAHQHRLTMFTADPTVGGRFSALAAFGLVPTGLAGVDVERLLDEAMAAQAECIRDHRENPALILGAALAGQHPQRNKLVIHDDTTHLPGFSAWIEQLVAESTGKQGLGLVPTVQLASSAEDALLDEAEDVLHVYLQGTNDGAHTPAGPGITVAGSIAAQFMVWEYAVAVACRLIGVNPFDQPDVETSKVAARSLLAGEPGNAQTPPNIADGPVRIAAYGDWANNANITDLSSAIEELGAASTSRSYVAVNVFADRNKHREIAATLQTALLEIFKRPTAFGWGPRFLHSTGQAHKGGPAEGIFIHILAGTVNDIDIPGLDHTGGEQLAAQATGDARVLAGRGRPVLMIKADDPAVGLPYIVDKLTEILKRS